MTNNIEIYVNNKRLDVGTDIDMSLNKSFEINGSVEFSYSFTIPSTYNNQCILGFSNKLHVINKFKNKYLTELYVNDVLILSGLLYIDSASDKFYSCNLISNQKIELKDAIKPKYKDEEGGDIYIDEIKLNTPDSDGKYYRWILKNPSDGGDWENCWLLNKENDETEYNKLNIVDGCLIYPFALYGKPINYLTGNGVRQPGSEHVQQDNNYEGRVLDGIYYDLAPIKNAQEYLRPSFRVVDIVKSIFLNSGFSNFTGTFFTDKRFTELYQTFQGNEKDYYDRDNQKFLFNIKKHIESVHNYIDTDGRAVDKSIARDYDYSIFDWKPEGYDNDFEDDRSIKFMCTRLFQPADIVLGGRNLITTDLSFSGTDWNYPIMKDLDLTETSNSFNEIVIKKAGWYNIKNKFSYTYETSNAGKTGGQYKPYSTRINKKYSIIPLCSNNIGRDYVNFANNIWEFQIVKHRSDPTIYSDVLSRRNQPYLENSPYLLPKNTRNIAQGRSEYIDTRFNSVKTPGNANNKEFANKLRVPENNNTLFVNSDDFVCGFRIGNQGYYDYEGLRPVNRERIGNILNLPYLNQEIVGGNFSTEHYTDDNMMLKIWSSSRGYKVSSDKAGVDINCGYYTPMNLTAINMLRKDNSFSAVNTYKKPTGINTNYEYDYEDYDYNDLPYKDELKNRFVMYDNYCDNRYKSNLVIKNLPSGFKVESSNLVWLDEGEYDARLISPVIGVNKQNLDPEDEDFSEEETDYYGVAHKNIDFDLSIEYIGISDKEWKPTSSNINESVYSDKYTYFNQYLPHETASDWVENLKNTFNLDFKFDNNLKEVSVNFNDNQNFPNSVDITNFVDFGSLKTSGSDSSINFKESTLPSKISIEMNNDENEYGINLNSGNYTFMLGGTNDPEVVKSKYSYPVIENIEVGDYEHPRVTVPTPIICTETVWKADYPYTQTYEYSGSKNARLYYRSGVAVGDKIYDTLVWFINYDTDKRYNFPILNVGSWDGVVNLQYPSTYMNSMWNLNSGVEFIEVTAYLPLFVYNNIRRNTLVKLDDSYFRISQIDNYDVSTTKCKITLTIIN